MSRLEVTASWISRSTRVRCARMRLASFPDLAGLDGGEDLAVLFERSRGTFGNAVDLLQSPLQEVADGVHRVHRHAIAGRRRHGHVEAHIRCRVGVSVVQALRHVLDGGRHGRDVLVGATRGSECSGLAFEHAP